jgi:hypothetical protein
MNDFIDSNDLNSFERYLKYQSILEGDGATFAEVAGRRGKDIHAEPKA